MKKDDSKEVVTNDTFRKAMINVSKRFESIDEKLEEMYTKKDHGKYMVLFDEAITELRESREERKLGEHQLIRIDDRVTDHEKRIGMIEEVIK